VSPVHLIIFPLTLLLLISSSIALGSAIPGTVALPGEISNTSVFCILSKLDGKPKKIDIYKIFDRVSLLNGCIS
jgi:hypothetical protein